MSETPSDEQATNERPGSGFWRVKPTVTDLVLAGGLVLANLYWWHREQTVRAGIQTTREWRREAMTGTVSGVADDESTGELPAGDALREAAELVNSAPADLPDRVETLDNKVRALTQETDHLRERWAATWWQGRETQRIAEAAGGDAGGTAELATGGGVSGDVEAAIQRLWDRIDVTVTESEVAT